MWRVTNKPFNVAFSLRLRLSPAAIGRSAGDGPSACGRYAGEARHADEADRAAWRRTAGRRQRDIAPVGGGGAQVKR